MLSERRLLLATSIGAALILAAGISDFLTGSFWEQHALLASLVANLVVVAVTLAVVNEILERRERRRWRLLAQNVLFALVQSARAVWTGMVELLQLGEVQSGAMQGLLDAAALARDRPRVSRAIDELLADPERRTQLQQATRALSEHASDVIAKWAAVMVGAGPYADVLDRHAELAGRLAWLSNVLAHRDPIDGRSQRERVLTRSSVAAERADELGTDAWLRTQTLAVIMLATELDYTSREDAYELVPFGWWDERTAGLAQQDPPSPPSEHDPPGAPGAPGAPGPPSAPS
jgi:hypothetical protein